MYVCTYVFVNSGLILTIYMQNKINFLGECFQRALQADRQD